MLRPYLQIPALPEIPEGNWVSMHLRRNDAGDLQYEIDSDPLPAMSTPAKKETVDILSLPVIRRYTSPRIKEVSFQGCPVFAKYACWPWEARYLSNEARAYQRIEEDLQDNEASLVPKVLAYLTENGRPMGLLLERLEGETPDVKDLPACKSALERLHESGVVHGDANKYNLLINRKSGLVHLVDLEHAEPWTHEAAEMRRQKWSRRIFRKC